MHRSVTRLEVSIFMHRFGNAFRRATARDLGVLALGVVLLVSGVGLSAWGSFGGDLTGCSPTSTHASSRGGEL